MKILTKSYFKKEIKENIRTGLDPFASARSLEHQYEMYAEVIQKALIDILVEGADFTGVNFG